MANENLKKFIKPGIALVYYLVAIVSLQLALPGTNATVVWPPSGIAFIALWIIGYEVWPAIWIGSMLANVTVFLQSNTDALPLHFLVSSFIATGNVMEAFIGVLLLEFFTKGESPLLKVRDVFIFVFVVMLACVPAATVGAFVVALSQGQEVLIPQIWFTWWLGDVVGILTVGPLLLAFLKMPPTRIPPQRAIEAVVMAIILVSVDIFVFSSPFASTFKYLVLPPIIWATYRFGYFGATISVLITLIICITETVRYGHFAGEELNNLLVLFQSFMGVVMGTVLVLAAALFERQQSEEELKSKEERFRKLVENSFEMLALLDSQGKITYISPSTINTLGYTVEESIGRSIFEWIHTQDHPAIMDKLAEVLNQPGAIVRIECRVRHKDSSWRWVEATGHNLLHELSIGAIVVNYRDITERKRMETVLFDSAKRLRLIVEATPNAIIMVDREGKIRLVNVQAEKLFGYQREELVGRKIDTLVPQRFQDQHPGYRNAFLAAPQARPMGAGRDLFGLRKDGTEVPIEIGLNPIEMPEGSFILASIIDITERKRAEKALFESEQRFRTMADTAPVMIWVAGTDTLCTFFNKSWLDFTGRTLEQEIGNGWASGVHTEDLTQCLDIYMKSFEARESFSMDYRLCRYDGQYRWILDRGVPRFTQDGQFAGYIGSCLDITELKMAQELLRVDKKTLQKIVEERTQELTRTQNELKQANRLADIGTLAATVAHELRNPLGVIQIAAYNLKIGKADSGVNRHLMNIEKKVWEGNQIIDNLLSYSRIKIPYYEKVALLNILDDCVATVQSRFLDKAVAVEKKYDAGVKFIEADTQQIREIFNNILNNAFQSLTKSGGVITLTVERQAGMVKVAVGDAGVGIAKEDLKKVFEPFFTRKSKGTGLGLAICNELAHLHQGAIEIASQQGVGTTVTVTLPIQRINE